MRAQIKLGQFMGVSIGLHYSWFIIALLITLSLAEHFRVNNPDWGESVIWATAILTALFFFAAIVVHELSHAAVAKAGAVSVRAITLFALGGVAEIEKEPGTAKTEFWIGVIGPITSFLIGLICLGIAFALGWTPAASPPTPLLAMLVWLGYINIILALFNMIPGFPLDGGRVLRAIVWWVSGDAKRATRIAATVGQFIAFGFIVLGIFRFFEGGDIGGLWLVFIGWFLLGAARGSYAQLAISAALDGVRVADVMSRDYLSVDSRSNLQTFVDEQLLRTGRRCFLVTENGHIEGLITAKEVSTIERARWPYTTVADAMRPLDQVRTVTTQTPVSDALEIMAREDVSQLPVVVDTELTGLISRGHILQLLQTRAELHV
jgi:Zn-dependent protease/predicted transcriptional regulator